MYLEINDFKESNIQDLLFIIQSSFKTVSDQYGFNQENAPTFPAFISKEKIEISIKDGVKYYFATNKDKNIGCIGIKKGNDVNQYYLERLAVLPEYRNSNAGTFILNFAISEIKKYDVDRISIGIINENTDLKNWYLKRKFIDCGVKKFDHQPFTVCFMEFKINKEDISNIEDINVLDQNKKVRRWPKKKSEIYSYEIYSRENK